VSLPAADQESRYQCRPAWAEVDLSAIAHNVGLLSGIVSPASLCAVVKAGGYGHGAVEVARAALSSGADCLAVALVEEGRELRAAGMAAPILILSEPPPSAMAEVVASRLTPTLYTFEGVSALRQAVGAAADGSFPVHVKVDTGMHRVGAASEEAVRIAAAVADDPLLDLEGFWTHLAVSDELDNIFTSIQVDRFEHSLAALNERGVEARLRHAANSAGAIWHPRARFDMVRCGIAMYGLAPAASMPSMPDLRPAMSLKAEVSYVKKVEAGERLSYGLRYKLERDSVVATVPLGYADGVTRSLGARGGEVLIAGQRCPIAGTVTMDQIMVDCGPDAQVVPGDEVVFIGRQGAEWITAWDWAEATGTIAYEVVCGISGRVPRVYLNGNWE
jgi:alanine racemase